MDGGFLWDAFWRVDCLGGPLWKLTLIVFKSNFADPERFCCFRSVFSGLRRWLMIYLPPGSERASLYDRGASSAVWESISSSSSSMVESGKSGAAWYKSYMCCVGRILQRLLILSD